MQATNVVCPLCSGVTKVANGGPAGQSICCQQCHGTFLLGPGANAQTQQADAAWWMQEEAPASNAETAKSSAIQGTTPAFAVPGSLPPVAAWAANQPSENRTGGFNPTLALGLIVGGLVMLLAIGGTVAALCFGPGDPDTVAVVEPQEPAYMPAPAPKAPKSPQAKLFSDPDKNAPKEAVKEPTPPPAELKKKDEPPDLPEPPPAPPAPKMPPEEPVKAPPKMPKDDAKARAAQQKSIDDSIDRGVKYLLQAQFNDGSWQGTGGHLLGTTALPALTLLECGTSYRDPRIATAADFVRKNSAQNHKTYEIALAILFLDKLIERKQAQKKAGDKKDELIASDKQIIQALALRLLAGQTLNGGWTYDCPNLTSSEATNMLATLKQNRPKAPPTAVDSGTRNNLPTAADKNDKGNLPNGVDKPKRDDPPARAPSKGGPDGTSLLETTPDWKSLPLLAGPPSPLAVVDPLRAASNGLQPPPKGFGPKDQPPMGGPKFKERDDNSNTQFAMMALWAARRHDIPVEKALLTVEQRFRVSQLRDGSWAYHFKENQPKASMTCVGLIGIALGKGTSAEMAMRGNKAGKAAPLKKVPMDAAIRDSLRFVSAHLEERKIENQIWPMGLSLYFMWSVERVAVLYDLQRIEGKDWYQWGVPMLLSAQRASGFWDTHSYAGANPIIDTSFALLFLKRVNLVQDLTDLQLYMAVPDAQGPPKGP